MTARECYINTLLFKPVDCIPFNPGRGRKSTRERWYQEGLPKNLTGEEITFEAYHQAGGEKELPSFAGKGGVKVDHFMEPKFEEKIIEIRENSQVVQDWKGNICEIGLEFDVSYLRSTIDFVTRNWIKCPVENRSDWEEMKKRYNPYDPKRFTIYKPDDGSDLKDRTIPLTVSFHGPYWQLREWCGFENLSMMFYDDPELVREMIAFWEDYIAALMQQAFKQIVPDEIYISEDMAYKGYSMLSPAMTREFLLPTWQRWGNQLKNAGVPIYSMDSDGFVAELIPLWIEAGFNVCDPMEVAAGNDIVALRKKFGQNIAFRGGVDKRKMAKGGRYIEEEMTRLLPVIQSGGFIPSCDHGIPSDVSWPDFVHFCQLLGKATGWIE